MLFAFSVAPTGGGDPSGSVHEAVAEAVQIVRDSGLPHRTDAMFTTVEGELTGKLERLEEAIARRDEH